MSRISKSMFEEYLRLKKNGFNPWSKKSLMTSLEREDIKHIIINFRSLYKQYKQGELS